MIRGPPRVSSQKGSASVLRAILHKKKRGKDKLDSPGASWQLIKPNRKTGAVKDSAQGQMI